jgi:AcrR family transcriptional regulator
MTDLYHHGDLKNKLIEHGKELILKNGLSNFSLRKLAAECNVSYAAPKNHFKDKGELIEAIINEIAEEFTEHLRLIYAAHKDDNDLLVLLGVGYVDFFINRPNYLSLFFHDFAIQDKIKMKDDGSIESNFLPFTFFMEIATDFLINHGVTEGLNECILTMWSLVHGISSIATYSFFTYNGDILELTRTILNQYVVANFQ